MRVLVVDDHEIVRRGVRSLLGDAGIEVCGEAVDGSDAILKAQELRPEAIVMDVSMPNLNGIEATTEIVRRFPETRVVLLSQHDFPHIVRLAVHAGASAYVVKSAISTDLLPVLLNARYPKWVSTPHLLGTAQRNMPVQEILQRAAVLEAALRDSEERYWLTFEEAAIGIAHIAPNGQWLRVNRKLCELLGYSESELIRRRVVDMAHLADLEEYRMQQARLASGEINQYAMEQRFVRKDASVVWTRVTVSRISDAKLTLRYFVSVIEDITAQRQAEHALQRSEQELVREVADLSRLRDISTELIHEGNGKTLYEKIVDAAVAIMRSEYASMQLLESQPGKAGELILLAFRGFSVEAAQFWQRVVADSRSTCGEALRTGKRVIVPDVEECEFMAETEDLTTYRNTGIRAVQSTPLLSRSGQIVGMISTHWKQVHMPTDRDLRMFDVLARQAADLVERRRLGLLRVVEEAPSTAAEWINSRKDQTAVTS